VWPAAPQSFEALGSEGTKRAGTIDCMAQVSAKDRALEVVNSLPDDASLDEAIERLCFIAKVEEGLAQSEAGELTPHEAVRRDIAS